MSLSVGIVGLPNVGKSTLFNALLKRQQALVANYPFATVEPNVGVVPVPDYRLERLAQIVQDSDSRGLLPPVVPATVRFVDIAGLVAGAAQGAGLGNKFLSHIREVSIICHVVRVFEDPNVIRYQDEREARLASRSDSESRRGSQDPENDYAAIQTELMLSDLESAQSHESKTKNKSEKLLTKIIIDELNVGTPVRNMKFTDEENEQVKQMFFLTNNPEIIVLNVNEEDYVSKNVLGIIDKYSRILQISKNKFVVICAKIEAELAGLTDEEQRQYLGELGFGSPAIDRLIKKTYETLGLISFLTTTGGKEVKAWTIKKGSKALEAAGEIHTDFAEKFIKAEVVTYDDFVKLGGWKGAREHGKARLEGKEYIVKDGDVIEFKIGS
ncbi:MAG: redox-regulated ATPase YchF [Candidatus Levybacteria bacterium RIFCSPLOWO2_01_FULL_39_10]|nr:MAG: redox-regulated ATPase YchF [Candidatus Levybacteria bacterium RIFCSPLOWO2_01_FULL_39_10]